MNLRQLEVFQAVMDQGGITRAAVALNVSQPSVSKTIKHLETQLRLQLFLRDKGRLVPTPEAVALYEEASKVYVGLRSILNIAEEMRSGRAGRLRIAASGVLGIDFLPRELSIFLKDRPNIKSSIVVRHVSKVEEMLASQQIDLGLVLFPADSPSINCSDIGQCRLVCVVSKNHKVSNKSALSPLDLQDVDLICYDELQPLGKLIETEFHKLGIPLRIGINVELCTTACSLARYSGKIAIVDEFTALAFPDLVSIPFEPEILVPISLLTPTHRPSSLIAQEFVRQIRESLKP